MAERTPGNAAGPGDAVERAYGLALWLVAKVEKFPRSFRFSVGDRIVARALDLMEALVEAAYAADKLPSLDRATRCVNSLRFLLRIAADLKLLSTDSHGFVSEKLEEVGRMAGGWKKAARRSVK